MRIIAETISLRAMYLFNLPRCNYNAAKFLARKIALRDHHCSAHWRAKQSRDVRSDPIELLSTHRRRGDSRGGDARGAVVARDGRDTAAVSGVRGGWRGWWRWRGAGQWGGSTAEEG